MRHRRHEDQHHSQRGWERGHRRPQCHLAARHVEVHTRPLAHCERQCERALHAGFGGGLGGRPVVRYWRSESLDRRSWAGGSCLPLPAQGAWPAHAHTIGIETLGSSQHLDHCERRRAPPLRPRCKRVVARGGPRRGVRTSPVDSRQIRPPQRSRLATCGRHQNHESGSSPCPQARARGCRRTRREGWAASLFGHVRTVGRRRLLGENLHSSGEAARCGLQDGGFVLHTTDRLAPRRCARGRLHGWAGGSFALASSTA